MEWLPAAPTQVDSIEIDDTNPQTQDCLQYLTDHEWL
jgi:hypothetical protein